MKSRVISWPYRWSDGDDQLINLPGKASNLLRQYVEGQARRRGLVQREDRSLYFPIGLVEDGKLRFGGFRGKTTWKQVVGNRSFRLSNNRREYIRYHQSVHFGIDLRTILGKPAVRVTVGLYLTDLNERPLSDRHAHARRRRIARQWYNDEWLNRVLAAVSFLADTSTSINLAHGTEARIVLAGEPCRLEAPFGIDERQLRRGNEILYLDEEYDDLAEAET